MKIKRRSAAIFAAVLAMTAIGGCGNSSNNTETTTTKAAPTQAATGETTTTAEGTDAFTYPMDGGKTVSYWMELNPNVAANFTNMSETKLGKGLQEATGITIDFQHPAVGQVTEQFNLLMSNKTLPDIIEYNWLGYSGGPQKAIEDGVIISLNDVIDQYCPNLKAYLEANPDIDKMVKTDDGTYYCFPFIRGGDKLLTSVGLMVRQDWLDELGLEVPETIEEWHTVLTEFKEKKGATAPFTYQYSSVSLTNNNPFAYAYNVTRDFYLADDGTIHFGAVEDGYKEYLMTMNQWIKEGLVDVDLATLTGDQVTAKITNGNAGAAFGYCGSGMGTWTGAGKATVPEYSLAPAPWPTTEKGKTPEFSQRDNNYIGTGSAVITTSCKDVEAAARLLDYAYSEEGHMLFNFGMEGESYTMESGEPVFTNEILNNPELSIAHSMSNYIRANYNGPFVQDERYVEQYYTLDSQKDALDVWSATNAKNHVIPPIAPTVDESKEKSEIMNEITTYRDEMTLKFMLGTKSFDEWDEYVETINNMNLSRVIEIQNAALERYKNR